MLVHLGIYCLSDEYIFNPERRFNSGLKDDLIVVFLVVCNS